MVAEIIDRGFSKSIKISDLDLESIFPNGLVNVNLNKNVIELTPVVNTRKNWDILFRSDTNETNSMIDIENQFDEEEWEW